MDSEEVENMRGLLKVYRDGTIFRLENPRMFVQPSLQGEGGVASKDVVLNETLGLWVRLYLPSSYLQQQTEKRRLPLIVYFHGGGFCLFSPAVPDLHNFTLKLTQSVGAIVVSVAYRLAPEHRLPAAYDDCITALQWVSSHAVDGGDFERDPWLHSHADFSQVYLLGDSAGGNIAHHGVVRSGGVEAWSPMKIRGAIFVQPGFGAEKRTRSESECPPDAFLTLQHSDACWRISLPVGSNRDHPFCNPWSDGAPKLEDVTLPPLLVAIGGRDMLRDSNYVYCESLKQCGKSVEVMVLEEEGHAFYALKPHCQSSERLMERISRFISSSPSESVIDITDVA
uniref:Alpha/beta hydrolase fold-3 domain-containing protein n=1 Tax=Picea sitchensis TaxID=3332 RepID=A9NZ91_PICSI|nr:unknown [Picea sitchensis]